MACDIIVKIRVSHDSSSAGINECREKVIGEIEWAFLIKKGKIIGIQKQRQDNDNRIVSSFSGNAGIGTAKVGNVGEGFCHFLAG